MKQTLEQKRARHAWDCANQAKEILGSSQTKDSYRDYVNAAKGMPALIINSGLMQVLAFCNGKKEERYGLLNEHLLTWLHQQCKTPEKFPAFMKAIMEATPQRYRTVNAEAMAWLRWLRQMAPAVEKGGEK